MSHISGLVAGVMSVVAMVWIDVRDGRGGVTVGTANKTNKERKKERKKMANSKQTNAGVDEC